MKAGKYYRPRRRGSNYAILITLLVNEASLDILGAKMTKDNIFNIADRNWGKEGCIDGSGVLTKIGLCKDGMRDNHRKNVPYTYDASSGISHLLDRQTNSRSRYLVKTTGRANGAFTLHLTDEGRRIAKLCHSDAHYFNVCGCCENVSGPAAEWMLLHTIKKLKSLCTDCKLKKTGTALTLAYRLRDYYNTKKQLEKEEEDDRKKSGGSSLLPTQQSYEKRRHRGEDVESYDVEQEFYKELERERKEDYLQDVLSEDDIFEEEELEEELEVERVGLKRFRNEDLKSETRKKKRNRSSSSSSSISSSSSSSSSSVFQISDDSDDEKADELFGKVLYSPYPEKKKRTKFEHHVSRAAVVSPPSHVVSTSVNVKPVVVEPVIVIDSSSDEEDTCNEDGGKIRLDGDGTIDLT